VHPVPKARIDGLFADAVRSNVTPSQVTRKFVNCGFVESYVNDPETGGGAPSSVVKLIMYVVVESACAGPATRAIKLNAPAKANFMVLMVSPLDDASPRRK
jgi:hypothetical protein